jgi:peptidoglycan/LPS O-acetylase OafA/YrhL
MLNTIQISRALAALFVIFNHYASYAFGVDVGGFGVDIFFVISKAYICNAHNFCCLW